MRIVEVEAIPVSIPLQRPLKMAVATVRVRTCLVVRIRTDDGVEGVGESVLARYFSGESHASAVDFVNTARDALIGMNPANLQQIRHLMQRIAVFNHGARAAVEMALHDVVAKAAGVPLYQWFGGSARDAVPTIWHVSGGTPHSMAEEAAKAAADGFPLVKVKVGGDVEHNIEATHLVREAIGPDVMLLPDANQGWDVGTALRYLRAIADTRPGFVEQPLPRWDLMGMATLTAQSPVIVAGDEGVFDAHELQTHLRANACGAAVAKFMKAAGPLGVLELFAVADAAGIGVHLAGMAGQTSIGAAHAAHLAKAVPNLVFGTGISPHYITDDIVTERFRPIEGHLYPSDKPGAGVEIDEDKLSYYRADP
ncbi:MAG: hypothetical protein OEM97_07540 [Acidimicrobiia bacterium]|nr:hypothetical protein [Acidimicrobiia bacterium]